MPRALLGVKEVAASLHVSGREVVRMADKSILPGTRVKGMWRFRASEVWNWIEDNLEALPKRRQKDKHPKPASELLVSETLFESTVSVNVVAKTKSSVIRELVKLAEHSDPMIHAPTLVEELLAREAQGSTALQDGIAMPHPANPFYVERPVLAAARTAQGVVFGERRGGLTDLFFLLCCPTHTDHLLYLGRLSRLLIDATLQNALREAEDESEFVRAIHDAEAALCQEV